MNRIEHPTRNADLESVGELDYKTLLVEAAQGAHHFDFRSIKGMMSVMDLLEREFVSSMRIPCATPLRPICWKRIPARKNFLFRVENLSRAFRGKFLYLMSKAIRQGKLPSPAPRLSNRDWVVYAKKPFASPQQVLDYLGRYTHRVAISNDRILCAKDGQVTFTYRDRKDKDRLKTKTLDAQEFIRRFLLHVLPDGFMRIRHFGFLANRTKKQALSRCRELLGLNPLLPKIPDSSTQDLLRELTGVDLSRCPACKKGTMVVVAELPKLRPWDSS